MSYSPIYSFREKMRPLLLFFVGYGVFYIFPNFYATWQPSLLPLSSLDQAVPFLPWTFLIYTSDYVLIGLTILIIDDKLSFNSLSRMMFFALIICGLFFLLLPTTYPRPIYPVLDNLIIQRAMDLVYMADSPNNCFPSMHVALTSIATWNLRSRSKAIFIPFVVWTLAIIVSTMTTKQHYFVDLVGGLTVVFLVALAEKKLIPHLATQHSKYNKILETFKFTKVL